MEKKYLLKKTGKEVKIGDEITLERIKETDLGTVKRTTVFSVTKDNINKLLKKDIIIEENVPTHTITGCLALIARKTHNNLFHTIDVYKSLLKIYPPAALSIILRALSLDFEEKYENDIYSTETIYFINMFNCKVGSIATKNAGNLNNFAAFRTLDDAYEALEICKPILDIMYGRKQEGKECNKESV